MNMSNNNRLEKANAERKINAQNFALKIIAKLNEIEKINDYKFQSLNDRCLALNYMKIKTRRGGRWSKTQMSRILTLGSK